MEIINAIKTRRSIRAFTDEAVSADVISKIVDVEITKAWYGEVIQ